MLWYGKSDIGMVRSANQDSFIARRLTDNAILCAVCDGMGGKAGGSEASTAALRVFDNEIGAFMKKIEAKDPLESSDSEIIGMLGEAVDKANAEVYRQAVSDRALSGMGTTLVSVFIYRARIYSVNVGDSRMYLISDGQAAQFTHDHSYVQHLVDIGKLTPEEARKSTNRNIITRAVGIDNKVDADIQVSDFPAGQDNYILLCSDGLTNHVENNEIALIVSKSDITIEQKADLLISAANEKGGTDNITVVLIKL